MENQVQNKWYNKTALVVLLLIVFFPVGLYALWKNEKLHVAVKAIVTAVVVLFVVGVITADDGTNSASQPTEGVSAEAEKKESEDITWEYDSVHNAMDDNITYYAKVEAMDVMEFQPPYDGGVTSHLIVGNKNKKNYVMLKISQGQFMAPINTTIRVKFDKEEPRTYHISEPADMSMDAVFISEEKDFIKRLKSAELTYVECEFFNEGTRMLRFPTKGFVWEH